MTLKDLKLKLPTKTQVDNDYDVACGLIDVLFRHINDSLQRDRSRVKVNVFAKSFIKASLEKTVSMTKDYVNGMYPEDIRLLIDDMETEILKRKKDISR